MTDRPLKKIHGSATATIRTRVRPLIPTIGDGETRGLSEGRFRPRWNAISRRYSASGPMLNLYRTTSGASSRNSLGSQPPRAHAETVHDNDITFYYVVVHPPSPREKRRTRKQRRTFARFCRHDDIDG